MKKNLRPQLRRDRFIVSNLDSNMTTVPVPNTRWFREPAPLLPLPRDLSRDFTPKFVEQRLPLAPRRSWVAPSVMSPATSSNTTPSPYPEVPILTPCSSFAITSETGSGGQTAANKAAISQSRRGRQGRQGVRLSQSSHDSRNCDRAHDSAPNLLLSGRNAKRRRPAEETIVELPRSELLSQLRELGFVQEERRNRVSRDDLRMALPYHPRLVVPDLDDAASELVAIELTAPDGTWLDDRNLRYLLLPRTSTDDLDVVSIDVVRRLVQASFDPSLKPARSTAKISAYRPFVARGDDKLLVMLVPADDIRVSDPQAKILRDFLQTPSPGLPS